MNLKERRALKAFQEDILPQWVTQINDAAQFEVEIEVDWGKLAKNEAAEDTDWSHRYAEAWPRVYFEPVVLAFKDITADDMGREALRENLNRIAVTNSGRFYHGEQAYRLEDKTLVIDHQPFANQDDTGLRHAALRSLLEQSL